MDQRLYEAVCGAMIPLEKLARHESNCHDCQRMISRGLSERYVSDYERENTR